MPLSDQTNQLSSNDHTNRTKQQQIWCEVCGKCISDKTRHFRSEIRTLRSQNHQISQDTRSALGTQSGVEVIVNENTYIKLKVNPTEFLEKQINDLLSKNYFPR